MLELKSKVGYKESKAVSIPSSSLNNSSLIPCLETRNLQLVWGFHWLLLFLIGAALIGAACALSCPPLTLPSTTTSNMHLLSLSLITLLCLTNFLPTESTQPPFSCDSTNPSTRPYPFCQEALPIPSRARDLVSRLTLDEKVSQLVNSAAAVPRLGIPAYEWWSEALHGVVGCSGINMDGKIRSATSFPQVILTGATFDDHLWYRIGQVTKQDLADTYQPPFQSCIEKGRASGIMCAYNPVNGVPNCADYDLLSKTARGLWGFQGYITSDCYAVEVIHGYQGYAKSPEDAVADVLKAGMDVNCGSDLKNYSKSAVQQQKLLVSDIDRALQNLFSVRMRLGLFNGNPAALLFGNITAADVCTRDHQSLALEAARNGIVLLKNLNKLLPLHKAKTPSLALIGPNANASETLLGNYEGTPCKRTSALQAFQGYVQNTVYHSGCDNVSCGSADIGKAVEISKGAEYVVLVMGLDQSQEREYKDRDDLLLPGMQQSLIQSVAKVAKNPVVLVLFCGGPVDVSFAKEDPKIGSMLWAGYPGEAGGVALAEIIFGDHNPGGKLPITWYPNDFVKVPMTDMRMRPDQSSGYPGRTYRFYNGKKVFEFGYGLSYTAFTYNFVSVSQKNLHLNQLSSTTKAVQDSDSVHYLSVSNLGSERCEKAKYSAVVRVKNEGEMDGRNPVLLFIGRENARKGSPVKQLVGFRSVRLKAGERAEVEFELNPCEHFSRANEDGLMVIEEGNHYLLVGEEKYTIAVEV
ncbi:hypothetical protein RHMOL_Rhmol07G0258200 [Rhododendron molle]|uniref:Uncharacterized protein n=1 Tax=Rhododendron molle TaxID=49168 RepID=A0ACC0N5V4_RHOML|nr:hypothetical protein RHMOL_Rhmol07G0258200 [Rhododendron molle]